MKRCLGWSLLLAAGLLLGAATSSLQTTHADPPGDGSAPSSSSKDDVNLAMLAELKEIKTQLKEINSHLRTGVTKTFQMMNPPDEKANEKAE
jgi:hypothetical protein